MSLHCQDICVWRGLLRQDVREIWAFLLPVRQDTSKVVSHLREFPGGDASTKYETNGNHIYRNEQEQSRLEPFTSTQFFTPYSSSLQGENFGVIGQANRGLLIYARHTQPTKRVVNQNFCPLVHSPV